MRKIFLIFTGITFLIIGCANQGITPLSPETEEEVSFKILSISGTPIGNPDLVSVFPHDENSWIHIHFNGVADTSKVGIIVVKNDGVEIPYKMEWNLKGRTADLILKPADTLDYNTTYVLKIIGSRVSNNKGVLIDKDDDGFSGEVCDDNYFYAFTTLKSDSSPGEHAINLNDIFNPYVYGDVYFLIGDSIVKEIWTDINIAINLFDLSWSKKDKSLVIRGVDSNTINDSTIMLILKDDEELKVPCIITYEGDTTKKNFGKVVINPEENLKPEKDYILRILCGITDEAGNKLSEYDEIAYEWEFITLSCNHDSSECLVKAPFIVNWVYLGSSFEVEFSKRIDSNTINNSTIYLEENGIRVDGDLSIRNVGRNTIVVFKRKGGKSISGTTAYVTSLISDLKGDKKGTTESHDF